MIDYEKNDLVTSSIVVKDSGYLYRKANEIYFTRKDFKSNKFIHKLLKIVYNKSNFEIKPNKFEFKESGDICTPNTAWFINRNSILKNKSTRYKLTEGDIIKFGRIKLRIKKIFFENESNNKDNYNENINKIKNNKEKEIKENYNEKINQIKQKICRICYSEETDQNDPLIQPCSCSGSLKYIHLSCLKKWLNTKSFIKVDNNAFCVSYLTKPAECELCKNIFPDFVFHNNKLIEIKTIESNFKNFLILESLNNDINKNKFIYIISLDNSEHLIKVGRGKDSDVLITDITVSRIHSNIIVENNNMNKSVYIEDNYSKFGTLILIQSPKIILCENLNLNIQVGRTFISCRIKEKKSFFKCCKSDEKPDINYYFKQNKKKEFMSMKTTIKNEINSLETLSQEEKKIDSKIKNDKEKILEDEVNIDNENTIKKDKDNQDKTTIGENIMDKQIKKENNIIIEKNESDNEQNIMDIKSNSDLENEINIYEVSYEEENISSSELIDLGKKPHKAQF